MPVSKSDRRSGLEDKASILDELTGQFEQRQRAQESDGRGQPGHAGKVGVDNRGRSKATYNISKTRQELVREMAKAEDDTSQASIVEAAIVMFYNAWQADKIDFYQYREPARALRAKWELIIPDDFNPFST